MILFHDTETFCEIPLRNGTHAYAEAAEVMVHSWAIGLDGEAKVWDATDGSAMPAELEDALGTAETIVGQNYGMFDRAVLRHNGIVIEPERIHDIMVQALSHGLPGSLDKLGTIFKLPADQAKDKAGKALIRLFCVPRPKNQKLRRATRETHPVEWQRFLEYARQDIPPMQALYRKMPRWNYPKRSNMLDEYQLWCLDQTINDRGFKVDVELAKAAIATVGDAKHDLDNDTWGITLGEVVSTSKRDQLLKHILSEYGVTLPDMQKSTLELRLADESLPWAVRELIAMRLQVSTTSNSKYASLLKGVSADGRLRGTLQFCGAARTGRWGGRLFQPQNLPRPNMKAEDIEDGIVAMKAGAAHLLYDNPIKLASNAIRGVIIAEEGKKLVVSDLANIEGRMLAWLAGEKWKLQAFREYDAGTGPDLYILGAAQVLRKPIEDVTKDERQSAGKVPELACGYQGAAGAFASMAALYGLDLPLHQVYEIVRLWRETNPAIVQFWYDMQEAAWQAHRHPGHVKTVQGKIAFEQWKSWLRMELPSGRTLCYASPAIIEDPRRKGSMTLSYMGLDSYTRQWKRLTTYGGKLAENATQAAARDVLASNMPRLEEAGYPIILTVHDEIIAEPLDDVKFSVDKASALLSKVPEWATGLPLAAGGFEGYRYRKD